MRDEINAALAAALALAAEGRKCFPCTAKKRPTTPNGFHDATGDSTALHALWRDYPGPLVGVPSGAVSGIDVLDLDSKHPEARQWWIVSRHRLPTTRTHRTRSGGLHLMFSHQQGTRCWVAKPVAGVDGRADGGYLIWWPAAGLSVLSDAPLASWPTWLLEEVITPQRTFLGARSAPPVNLSLRAGSSYAAAALRNATERVARAPIGCRNHTLNSAVYGLGRLVEEGLLDGQQVADTLAAAAFAAGLGPREIEATLRSGLRAQGLL